MNNENTDRLIECVAFITGTLRQHPDGPEINPEREARRWIWYSSGNPEDDSVWITVVKDGDVAVELQLYEEMNSHEYLAIIGFCAIRNIPCIIHTDDVRLGVETTVLGEDEDDDDDDDADEAEETKH